MTAIRSLSSIRKPFYAGLLITLALLHGCSKKSSPLPPGWQVATYSNPSDLRHSPSFHRTPSTIWTVKWSHGQLDIQDFGLHNIGSDPKNSWEDSGISNRAKTMALNFGKYIVDRSPEYALSQIVATDDGWLVGFDAGEWSGGLCWVSKDGSRGRFLMTEPALYPPPPPPPPPGTTPSQWARETKEMRRTEPDLPGWIPLSQFNINNHCSENVIAIHEFRGSYFVFTGLTHGRSTGKILKISRSPQGVWTPVELLRLDSEPRVVSPDGEGHWTLITQKTLIQVDANGGIQTQIPLPESLVGDLGGDFAVALVSEKPTSWLVLTPRNLYRIPKTGQSALLLSGAFTPDPQMNSIVRMPDGTVYIGMRHYLLHMKPCDNTKEPHYQIERLEKI